MENIRSCRVAVITLTLAGCIPVGVPAPEVRQTSEIGSISHNNTAVRLHMADGSLYRFSAWEEIRESTGTIAGTGAYFGIDRQQVSEGDYVVPLDSVVLIGIDRGRAIRPFGLSFLTTMTTLTAVVTISCIADPKSCFGSCPTFYLVDGDSDRPVAEGFSASIARVLEATDTDRLGVTASGGDTVVLEMRNEALETHSVRHARLVAVPATPDGYVVADAAGGFYRTSAVATPLTCTSLGGDCTAAVSALDQTEYWSLTDSTDLGARETVELEFGNPGGPTALVLEARQTFVSTFLIYQAMAYMGREAEYWLAALERNDAAAHSAYRRLMETTGAIRVSVRAADGVWHPTGRFTEAGPIATDVQAIPFPGTGPGETVRVRLEMARGSWRIGYAALARIEPAGAAAVIDPLPLEQTGDNAEAFRSLRDPDGYLVTQPGDRYRLAYPIPVGDSEYELFLETRGFYYEWMRQEWLAEENTVMTALLFSDPASALMLMAPHFKHLEPGFEESFWQSRFRGQQ